MLKTYLYNLVKSEKTNFIGNIVKFFLLLLSYLYYLVIEIRRRLYAYNLFKISKLDCKVISIGNITLGGTGKTPMVEFLAKKLKKRGRNVAVLLQGYQRDTGYGIRDTGYGKREAGSGKRDTGNFFTRNPKPVSRLLGDEAILLKEKLADIPLLVGKNRVKTGKQAIEKYKVDTLILDDAFQYQRLHRDLDIVLIDATNPFDNNYLLPRGFLREPIKNLSRADFFILTKTNLTEEKKQVSQILLAEAEYRPICLFDLVAKKKRDLKDLFSQEVGIFSAIGNPDAFHKTVEGLCKVRTEISFPDHYQYKARDIKKIINNCSQKNIRIIITTEKDAVKIKDFLEFFKEPLSVFCLEMEIKITKGKEKLDAVINSAISN